METVGAVVAPIWTMLSGSNPYPVIDSVSPGLICKFETPNIRRSLGETAIKALRAEMVPREVGDEIGAYGLTDGLVAVVVEVVAGWLFLGTVVCGFVAGFVGLVDVEVIAGTIRGTRFGLVDTETPGVVDF